MATWKLHKKKKEDWWMELWRNSQIAATAQEVAGWNPDGRELKAVGPKQERVVGKLPPRNEQNEGNDQPGGRIRRSVAIWVHLTSFSCDLC
jgi:hypothetical protein